MANYLDVNRANWDERAPAHAASPDYAVERFIADPGFLSEVIRFDVPLLGDVRGLRCVHLQCHIGTDTISLARLGAIVTGLDFSAASVVEARRLAQLCGTPVDFVESDVYDALEILPPEGYDLVFTGVGALCWLPDIRRWANVVAGLLRPGGRLFIREGHPMLRALDESHTDDLVVGYPGDETLDEPLPLLWSVCRLPGCLERLHRTVVALELELIMSLTRCSLPPEILRASSRRERNPPNPVRSSRDIGSAAAAVHPQASSAA